MLPHTFMMTKQIAISLGIADRVEVLVERNPFITLTDHKTNFASNPKCHLINLAKSKIDQVTKHILEMINDDIRRAINLPLWTSTNKV